MKTIIILLILAVSASNSIAKAYFAREMEMVTNAEFIAIVNVQWTSEFKETTPFPYQVATGTVERVLKGEQPEAISFHVPTFYPCAVTEVHAGRYLVFLRKEFGALQGNNWYYSYRPISDGIIEWYKDTNTLDMAEMPLESVVQQIEEQMKNPQQAGAGYPPQSVGSPDP